MRRLIRSTMLKMAENKHIYAQDCLNLTLVHNQLKVIRNNIFATVQGTDTNQRSGDKIFARYIQFKMYFENQQYRPKASYLVLVLRNKNNPSANIADNEDIYETVSTSKNLDYIDYNKYQILYSKRVNVSDAGSYAGTSGTMSTGNPAIDGVAEYGAAKMSNPARYHTFKVYLNKTLEYLDGSNTPSTQKYAIAVIPYATFSTTTGGTVYPVGHVSCVSKFYFKDP